uniref:Uncharacterized protein n=1 Tax=Setaria italica TaxID=4555 RepID=K3ZGD3_SETIT
MLNIGFFDRTNCMIMHFKHSCTPIFPPEYGTTSI